MQTVQCTYLKVPLLHSLSAILSPGVGSRDVSKILLVQSKLHRDRAALCRARFLSLSAFSAFSAFFLSLAATEKPTTTPNTISREHLFAAREYELYLVIRVQREPTRVTFFLKNLAWPGAGPLVLVYSSRQNYRAAPCTKRPESDSLRLVLARLTMQFNINILEQNKNKNQTKTKTKTKEHESIRRSFYAARPRSPEVALGSSLGGLAP